MADELRRAIGLADLCELLCAAFTFPEADFAEALSDGSFSSDAASCLRDAGADGRIGEAELLLGAFAARPSGHLLDSLRKGFSILYLAPGADVPVWPYESAFCFEESGGKGAPTLFRSVSTKDVERHMREAGVLPKAARKEPADSIWDELSFMSYLYGSFAGALHEGREADAAEWSGRIARFWDEHASKWMPAFMEKTQAEAPLHSFGAEYAVLAQVGVLALGVVEEDVEGRRAAK